MSGREVLTNVSLKTGRAQHHLEELKIAVNRWLGKPPYFITQTTDFDRELHIVRVHIDYSDPDIPVRVGDFVCNLRSALDQLAWGLAHTDKKRVFTDREQRQISFPIFWLNDATCKHRLSLFPSAVACELDKLQPHHRVEAYKDDLLWQLNELWTLDKHRMVALNCSSIKLTLHIATERWPKIVELPNCLVVPFPLWQAFWLQSRGIDLKPSVSIEVLFGEYMGNFEVTLPGLEEIHRFVRDDVIPKFTRFFS